MNGKVSLGARTLLLAALLVGALFGCRDRAPLQRDTAVAPPPAAQGPVNPDAGVTTYACVDGQTVTAGYPDHETAVVTFKDHAYTLKLAPSARGSRYTGYGLQWWVEDAHGAISALQPGEETASASGLACTATGVSASATRADFKPISSLEPGPDPAFFAASWRKVSAMTYWSCQAPPSL